MMERVLQYAAVALVLALLLGEAILRWGVSLGDPPLARLNPVTEYELVPSAQYRRWGNDIEINAHGMRAPDHDAIPGPDTRHVLIIGDSVVYGGHFLDQQETIAARLVQRLTQEPALEGCEVRVLPMAVSSWGPINQAAALERDGAFGASVAMIVLSAHDLYDVPRDPVDILPYRTTSPLTAVGDAFEVLRERVFQPEIAAEPRSSEMRAEMTMEALDEMRGYLMAQSIPLVLVYHPTTREVSGQARNERVVFQDWAVSREVPFWDLTPEMEVAGYRDDIHPNAAGADQIAGKLRTAVIFDLPGCGG